MSFWKRLFKKSNFKEYKLTVTFPTAALVTVHAENEKDAIDRFYAGTFGYVTLNGVEKAKIVKIDER